MKTLSVVIPTHNRAHLLGRAVRSVLSQLRYEDELIVVDDGSSDGTEQLAESFDDRRVRWIRQPQSGAGAARNRGTREASGDWIAYLDSDDEWLPGKAELQRAFLEYCPEILFCFTDFYREFGGRRYARSIRDWHTDPRGWNEIFSCEPRLFSSVFALPAGMPDCPVYCEEFGSSSFYRGEMHTNYILTSSLMVRRKAAGAALHFGEGVSTFEDWECFGRLAQTGPAGFLEIETAVQYGHEGPRLTDAGILPSAESRLTVLQRVWGSDRRFLAAHGDEYEALIREQKLLRIRGFLVHGQTESARREIANLRSVPRSYRALSFLPGAWVAFALGLRRSFV